MTTRTRRPRTTYQTVIEAQLTGPAGAVITLTYTIAGVAAVEDVGWNITDGFVTAYGDGCPLFAIPVDRLLYVRRRIEDVSP